MKIKYNIIVHRIKTCAINIMALLCIGIIFGLVLLILEWFGL